MKNNTKTYQTAKNEIALAMQKAPLENVKAFYAGLDKNQTQQVRRWIKPNFKIHKCNAWIVKHCEKHFNMRSEQFDVPNNNVKNASSLGLTKSNK